MDKEKLAKFSSTVHGHTWVSVTECMPGTPATRQVCIHSFTVSQGWKWFTQGEWTEKLGREGKSWEQCLLKCVAPQLCSALWRQEQQSRTSEALQGPTVLARSGSGLLTTARLQEPIRLRNWGQAEGQISLAGRHSPTAWLRWSWEPPGDL